MPSLIGLPQRSLQPPGKSIARPLLHRRLHAWDVCEAAGTATWLWRSRAPVAAAAAPHKQRAVAAGTAVGEDVGEVGGKSPAGDDG
eukprot:519446-Prymnesium_polylepis.1